MDGVTIVLGWDALDYDLVETFGLTEAFGPHYSRLETFDNPRLGKPHTYEVWPSIITGTTPKEHGIHIESKNGVDWKHPAIAAISRTAQGIVPRRIRTKFGRRLQNRGVKLDFKSADYYEARGISTVFDGRTARPVAIPNYRVPGDDELGIVFDRGAHLKQFLNVKDTGNGNTQSVPTASLSRLEERLAAEAAGKLGVVHSAIQREYDLIFVWLGFLDTIGHVAPVAAETDPNWQERAYRMAAKWTTEIKNIIQETDRLMCVSDHGLQNGEHTHAAFIGATERQFPRRADSVCDLRSVIETVTSSNGKTGEPELRDEFRGEDSIPSRTAEDVRNQLDDLGYL